MIVAVVEELPDVVFAGNSEFNEICVDDRSSFGEAFIADWDVAAVLGDVRYQDEELKYLCSQHFDIAPTS